MIYINGTPLSVTLFPDNTSQVWKVPQLELPNTNWVHIKWEFSHEGEFLHLAQLKTLIDTKGFDATLRIKYLPYGRQDKEVSNESTFGLRTFATLLNSLDFSEVIIHDPHSVIALDLIKNSRAIFPTDELEKVVQMTKTTMFCYPDKGAVSKYSEVSGYNLWTFPIISGEKVRDQLTGNILSYEVTGNPMFENILIIDDICDGGMTFKLLAQDLLRMGAGDVNLFVTHGIFSKGLKTLKESGINRIFTQDGEASEIQQHITYRRI